MNPHEAQKKRIQLFGDNQSKLEVIAMHALSAGLLPTEFVTLCIHVNDPSWAYLASKLLNPLHLMYVRVTARELAVANIFAMPSIINIVHQRIPEVNNSIFTTLKRNQVVALVLAYQGATGLGFIPKRLKK